MSIFFPSLPSHCVNGAGDRGCAGVDMNIPDSRAVVPASTNLHHRKSLESWLEHKLFWSGRRCVYAHALKRTGTVQTPRACVCVLACI